MDFFCRAASASISKRQAVLHEVQRLVKSLPEMENSIKEIGDDLSQAMACMEELERAIQSKEESLFQIEMRKRFDSQYVLKIHEEKLNREFEKIAVSLEAEHMRRIREFRISEENAIRVKQESFRRAFEQELMDYKRGARIHRPEPADASAGPSLEEILVEPDEDDRLCLEQFLDDSSDQSEH